MNHSAPIATIVPSLPPAVGGVEDYSFYLAKQFRQDFGIESLFIVGDPGWNHSASTHAFATKVVASRSKDALLAHLAGVSNTVLLHYVGHGYAKRGCPSWLIAGLTQWKQAQADRRLVTMFHELYATGPLWSSAVLTSPLQKHLAMQLMQLSDVCLTSKQGYAEIIQRLSQGKHRQVSVLPVFSTVGEPSQLKTLVDRPRRLVIFGGRGNRARAYQRSRQELEQICCDLEIREILDIGPPFSEPIPPIHGILVQRLGVQPLAVISDRLANSMVGFFNYHPEYLAKSTIFAAYCAHGLLPIGVPYRAREVDGLFAGQHYWLINQHQSPLSHELAQTIADQAYHWYWQHRLAAQARIFMASLAVI